jgi:hypothetical protein
MTATKTGEINETTGFPIWDYGKWQRAAPPSDEFVGYKTDQRRFKISEKQERFWNSCARSQGLNPEVRVDARKFQIMPILRDLGVRL